MTVVRQFLSSIMHTAPLFPVAAGMITGIVLDRSMEIDVFVYVALLTTTTAATILLRHVREGRKIIFLPSIPALIFVASACAGGVLHARAAGTISASSIEHYVHGGKRIARLRGVVVSEPRLLDPPPNPFARWTYGYERTAFLLETEAIEDSEDQGRSPSFAAPRGLKPAARDAARDAAQDTVRDAVRDAVRDGLETASDESMDEVEPTKSPLSDSLRTPQSSIHNRIPGEQGSLCLLVPVHGRIRVTVGEAVLDLRAGERVEVFGWLHPLEPPRNPGAFDWSAFQRRQGVVATLRCKHRENVRRIAADLPPRRGLITRLRTTVRGLLTDDLSTGAEEEASLLEAMILGHRSRLDRRLNEIFIRAGCIHFLAVSGVHVVIVMFFAGLAARMFMGGPRLCTWFMLIAVVIYAIIAEPRPPILRATLIAVIYCAARLLGRERSCLNWIPASAIVLAVFDPPMIFDVGYQLSFAAVLGVSYLSPALLVAAAEARGIYERVILKRPYADEDRRIMKSRAYPRRLFARALRRGWSSLHRYARVGLSITFGAWLAALPIVACYFHRVQPWGPLNSLLSFPLVSLLMALGFAKVLVETILPGLGSVIAGPLTAVDSVLISFVDHLGSLPGASLVGSSPPWWLIVSYYAFLSSLVLRFPRDVLLSLGPTPVPGQLRSAQPRAPRSLWGATFVLLAISGVAWYWPRTPDRLTVTILSVGTGSATVIELPDGRTVLYDAGSMNPADVGRNTVVPYLRHRGISQIERVYLSHPNLDHFSGLPSILEEIDVGPIIVNRYFEPRSPRGSPSRHLLDVLAERGHPIKTLAPMQTQWEMGGATFELLSPRCDYDNRTGLALPALSTNDSSMVLRISYAGHSILLTGDIEERTQRRLLKQGGLESDVLVLPHHGSIEPSTEAFIEAVGAAALIRSSREPMKETYSSLPAIAYPRPLYNTADVGAVQVVIDGDGVAISTTRWNGE